MMFFPIGLRIGRWIALVILLLVACDGTSAQSSLIGSSGRVGPSSGSTRPIAQYPHPIGQAVIVHTANLELLVGDIEQAEAMAVGLASKYGGAVSSSQRWRQDGRLYATLIVDVPAYQFESTRRGLIALGALQSEQHSETIVAGGSSRPYSRLTVRLVTSRPHFNPPELPSSSRSKEYRLQSAVAQLTKIITTWAKIVTWIVKMMAPWVLLGLGLLVLLKGRSKS